MRSFISVGLLLIAGVVGTAYAQQETYIGATYIQANYTEPGYSLSNGLAGIRAGINEGNFGLEGFAAGAVSEDSFYYGSSLVKFKVQSLYGAYLKARTDGDVSFYIKGGVATGTVSASTRFGSVWVKDTSLSYGAGLEGKIGKEAYFQVDYSSYYNRYDVQVGGASVTIGFAF